ADQSVPRPSRIFVVSENSKSLMSPRAMTFAFFWILRIFAVKSWTALAWRWRWVSEERAGGWLTPVRLSSPPLDEKWLAITMTVRPRKVNSPARGLRLSVNASEVGSTRPGEWVRA